MFERGIMGMPDAQEAFCAPQIYPDNCAVCAETSLLNQCIPGLNLDQETAANISAANNWYVPGQGTSPSVIGKMLESSGIATHTMYNATIEQLASEVMQGHGVIVGGRAADLWDSGALAELKNFLCDIFGLDNSLFQPADHAFVVTGFDVSDPENPQVIINDSGVLNGAGARYPLSKFKDAWDNSNCYYVATDEPIQELAQQSIIQNVLRNGFSDVSQNGILDTNAFFNAAQRTTITDFCQDNNNARLI